ncbi:MAG: MFS transporter, partial [Pseudonocardia sp.]|nr:MFS transporter [Pseudonocardia sp.]
MDATRRQRRAWYGCDWANSVFSTSVVAVFFGPYLTDVARAAADETGSVRLLGVSLRPEAIFPGVIGLATLLLLGVLPVTAVATRRLPRAELLGALTLVGAGATMGLATVHGDAYVRGSVLFIVALVMLAASIVVIDTFLPELAARGERGRVSATASSAGFASACLVLALSFGVVSGPLDLAESTAVRLCLLLAGLWWLLFMIWPVIALRGMSTTVDEDEDGAGGGHPVGLRRVARVLWRTPLVPAFLVAYLLYNNGLQGVSSLSGTFGSEALRIDEGELIVAVLITTAAGAVGALVAGRLSRRVGTLRVLAGCLVLLALT